MLSIENAAYTIPAKLLALESSSDWLGISPSTAKIYQRMFGLGTFPVEENLSVYQLLEKSLQKLKFDSNNIKLIIHAHTAQVICPYGSSVVQVLRHKFQLRHAIYCGTALNNCTALFSAFEIAEQFLTMSEEKAEVLILTGEINFTKDMRVVPGASVTGDASAAMLVSKKSATDRLLAVTLSHHGQFAKGLWISPEEQVHFEAIFLSSLKIVIEETLDKANIRLEDVALILPHNVNTHVWNEISKGLNFARDKIFMDNIKQYAHCFGSDLIMNYVDAKQRQRLKKGDYYLMIAVGLGATLGAAVFQH